MSTLSDKVAAEIVTVEPDAVEVCLNCSKQYLIDRPPGPSMVCPRCGKVPSDSICAIRLKAIETIRLAGDLTESLHVAGSQPPLVWIQCRCSECGATSEATPRKVGKDVICPECGKKLTAADRLASELIAFNPDATTRCQHCKTPFSVMQCGMTCPRCEGVPSEEACKAALECRIARMGDWRSIKHRNALLRDTSAGGKAPRFTCPYCKAELPSSLAERNFARLVCTHCNHYGLYIYNAEAFQNPQECERIQEFRLEKRKKAEEKARQREIANAAQDIATGTRADRGQANAGFVYALLNSTMPGLVKIGMTEREPEERAKELSCGTGIPTPFVVAYAESFKDRFAAEGYVHSLMEQKGFRVSQNREFFCAPVKAAIQAIMKAKEREDLSDGSPGTPANVRSPE